jgi:hypothetical protein
MLQQIYTWVSSSAALSTHLEHLRDVILHTFHESDSIVAAPPRKEKRDLSVRPIFGEHLHAP